MRKETWGSGIKTLPHPSPSRSWSSQGDPQQKGNTMKHHQIEIEKALVKAMYGREFPWHTAGIVRTGGDCWAYQIDGETSEDPKDAKPWFALITDIDSPFLDTNGPYSVTIWDHYKSEQIGEPVVAIDAQSAITAVEYLFRTTFGTAFIDENGVIQTTPVPAREAS